MDSGGRVPARGGRGLVTLVATGYLNGQPHTSWLCWNGDDQEWTDMDRDIILE